MIPLWLEFPWNFSQDLVTPPHHEHWPGGGGGVQGIPGCVNQSLNSLRFSEALALGRCHGPVEARLKPVVVCSLCIS